MRQKKKLAILCVSMSRTYPTDKPLIKDVFTFAINVVSIFLLLSR